MLPAVSAVRTRTPWMAARLRNGIERRLSGLEGSLRLVEAWSGRVRELGRGDVAATITIERPGYTTWTQTGVVVSADECHVIPVLLSAEMVPLP